MGKRDKQQKPYRDYSDDSWFTQLMNGLGYSGGCCSYTLFAAVGALALVGWLVSWIL